MSDGPRILITGFGPFPGAPFNPTEPLVARLLQLRRPALSDVKIFGHVFQVTYEDVDRQLPLLLASHRPHALLMFGLASRTSYVRIETRARNAGSYLCNYLSWRAIEAARRDNGPRLVAFVHVPLLARARWYQDRGTPHRISLEELVDAGEAMLLEMVKLARQAVRSSASS